MRSFEKHIYPLKDSIMRKLLTSLPVVAGPIAVGFLFPVIWTMIALPCFGWRSLGFWACLLLATIGGIAAGYAFLQRLTQGKENDSLKISAVVVGVVFPLLVLVAWFISGREGAEHAAGKSGLKNSDKITVKRLNDVEKFDTDALVFRYYTEGPGRIDPVTNKPAWSTPVLHHTVYHDWKDGERFVDHLPFNLAALQGGKVIVRCDKYNVHQHWLYIGDESKWENFGFSKEIPITAWKHVMIRGHLANKARQLPPPIKIEVEVHPPQHDRQVSIITNRLIVAQHDKDPLVVDWGALPDPAVYDWKVEVRFAYPFN